MFLSSDIIGLMKSPQNRRFLALALLMLFGCGLAQGIKDPTYGNWRGRTTDGELISISAEEETEFGYGTSLSFACFGGESGDFTARLYGFDDARFEGFQDISMRVATEDGPVEIALAPSEESNQLLIDPEPSNLGTLVDTALTAASDYADLRIEVTVGYFSEVQVFDTYGFGDALNDLPCYPRFNEANNSAEQSSDDIESDLPSVWQLQDDFVYTTDSNQDGTLAAIRVDGLPLASVVVPSIPSQGLSDAVEVRYSFEGGGNSVPVQTDTWDIEPSTDFIFLIASSQFNSTFNEFASETDVPVSIRIEILNSDGNAVYNNSFFMTGFAETFEKLD